MPSTWSTAGNGRNRMNLHEYQAKSLFAEYGLPVSPGIAAQSAGAAVAAAEEIGGDRWAVKVQVHAGGRGKAGGVKVAGSLDEVRAFAERWIGKSLVTAQTDAGGAAGKHDLRGTVRRHRAGAVSRRRHRPQPPPHRLHGVNGRRRGNREGGGRNPGEDPAGSHRPVTPARSRTRAGRLPSASVSRAPR